MNNIIQCAIGAHKHGVTVTRPAWLYDYGMKLKIVGLELPTAYEVDFAHSKNETATRMVGDADGVDIPNALFESGTQILAWLYVHEDLNDGYTVYEIKIPLLQRPHVDGAEPTPAQQDAIDVAITALNDAIERTSADVVESSANAERAENAAESADASATEANSSKINARGYANQAAQFAQSAQSSASTATAQAQAAASSAISAANAASSAANSAEAAETARQQAESEKEAAQTARTGAERAETNAGGSASAAANSASAAATSAANAGNSAAQAAQSADNAQKSVTAAAGSASAAAGSATDAQAANTAAQQAKTDAETAKTAAESARDRAETAAVSVVESVAQIEINREDIEDLKSALNNSTETITFVLPRAYYWAWYTHTHGSISDDHFSQDRRYYESELFTNIPSFVIVEVADNINNIQVCDNITADVTPSDFKSRLYFDKDSPVRFRVRWNNGASDIDASVLDYIKVTMTVTGFNYFIDHYTLKTDITANWIASYGYYNSANRRGTRIYGEQRDAYKYPIYKENTLIRRKASSGSAYIFQQDFAGTFANQTQSFSDITTPTITIDKDFVWSGNASSIGEICEYPVSLLPYGSRTGGNNRYFNPQVNNVNNLGRVASACLHGDYIYMLGDTGDSTLRKINKSTWDIVAEYPITSEQVGHANGSNLIGDIWYVSDWYDPNICHRIDLTNDSPTVLEDISLPVTDAIQNADRGLIYMVSTTLAYTIDWIAVGENKNARLTLSTWYNLAGEWRVAETHNLPVFGLVQDICIVNGVLYAPVSKMTDPNKYTWRGLLVYNLGSAKYMLAQNTNRAEPEAIFAVDDFVMYVVLANGYSCAIGTANIDWSKSDAQNISSVAFDALSATE